MMRPEVILGIRVISKHITEWTCSISLGDVGGQSCAGFLKCRDAKQRFAQPPRK